MKSGIYKIVNEVTGKCYVGSSIDIDRRWGQHRNSLQKDKHLTPHLQNSVNKHGLNNFVFEVVEECVSNMLIEREQFWIDVLDSYDNGYNARPKAESRIGTKLSEEHKQKISEAHKGKPKTKEHKDSMSKSRKGDTPWNKGKKGVQIPSEETKKKLSLVLKGKTYEEIYGKEKAEEMKQKRRKKRKPMSEEQKLIISQRMKDYYSKNGTNHLQKKKGTN
jgi:group I intron endonuclease